MKRIMSLTDFKPITITEVITEWFEDHAEAVGYGIGEASAESDAEFLIQHLKDCDYEIVDTLKFDITPKQFV